MTTQEVANRYYELIQQHQYAQIQNELYASDAISIEPENDSNLPLVVQGLDALRQKEGLFFAQVEEMHGSYMSEIVLNFQKIFTFGRIVNVGIGYTHFLRQPFRFA